MDLTRWDSPSLPDLNPRNSTRNAGRHAATCEACFPGFTPSFSASPQCSHVMLERASLMGNRWRDWSGDTEHGYDTLHLPGPPPKGSGCLCTQINPSVRQHMAFCRKQLTCMTSTGQPHVTAGEKDCSLPENCTLRRTKRRCLAQFLGTSEITWNTDERTNKVLRPLEKKIHHVKVVSRMGSVASYMDSRVAGGFPPSWVPRGLHLLQAV